MSAEVPQLVIPISDVTTAIRPGPFAELSNRVEEMREYFCASEAKRDHDYWMVRTLAFEHDGKLLGCASVQADSIRLDPKSRDETLPYLAVPAIKLARFARNDAIKACRVEIDDRLLSVGEFMMFYVKGYCRVLANSLGVRFMTLDALPEQKLISWYKQQRFVETGVQMLEDDGVTPAQEVNMLFDLRTSDTTW